MFKPSIFWEDIFDEESVLLSCEPLHICLLSVLYGPCILYQSFFKPPFWLVGFEPTRLIPEFKDLEGKAFHQNPAQRILEANKEGPYWIRDPL